MAGEGPVFRFEGPAPRVWVDDSVIAPAQRERGHSDRRRRSRRPRLAGTGQSLRPDRGLSSAGRRATRPRPRPQVRRLGRDGVAHPRDRLDGHPGSGLERDRPGAGAGAGEPQSQPGVPAGRDPAGQSATWGPACGKDRSPCWLPPSSSQPTWLTAAASASARRLPRASIWPRRKHPTPAVPMPVAEPGEPRPGTRPDGRPRRVGPHAAGSDARDARDARHAAERA